MLRLFGCRVNGSPPSLLGPLRRGTRCLSAPAPKMAAPPMAHVFPGLKQLRDTMDDHVIGHDDIKEAMMLGLLAREHCYLEGPPGVAKTMLSEIVSVSTDLKYWFYQMHRDTRISELVGESVIVRSNDEQGLCRAFAFYPECTVMMGPLSEPPKVLGIRVPAFPLFENAPP